MNDDDSWVNKYFTPNPPFQPLEAFPCSVLSLFYYKHEGIPVATGRQFLLGLPCNTSLTIFVYNLPNTEAQVPQPLTVGREIKDTFPFIFFLSPHMYLLMEKTFKQ